MEAYPLYAAEEFDINVNVPALNYVLFGDSEIPTDLLSLVDADSEGVLSLWKAVLLRAIADWLLYHGSTAAPQADWGADAYDWLFLEETNEIGSFIMICDLLGRDAAIVRERLQNPPPELKILIRNRRARRRTNG